MQDLLNVEFAHNLNCLFISKILGIYQLLLRNSVLKIIPPRIPDFLTESFYQFKTLALYFNYYALILLLRFLHYSSQSKTLLAKVLSEGICVQDLLNVEFAHNLNCLCISKILGIY